jgi:hypothetical protein
MIRFFLFSFLFEKLSIITKTINDLTAFVELEQENKTLLLVEITI